MRELALRLVAKLTEEQWQAYLTEHGIHQTWATTERVLVEFDQHPHSQHVIREAARLAHGLDADLLAVFIEPEDTSTRIHRVVTRLTTGKEASTIQQVAAQRRLQEHIRLAKELGAEIMQARNRDRARALAEIAREHHVTQLVLSQPTRSRWDAFGRGSTVDRVLCLSSEMELHLVPRQAKP